MTADITGGCRRTSPRHATRTGWSYPLLGTLTALIASGAQAQPAPDPTIVQLPPLNVTGARSPVDTLDQTNATGTRLGLTTRETPATIDTIDAKTMEERGYNHVQDAVNSLPGVTSGGSPGDPVGLSVRGFTVNEITLLRDGIYQGPASMVNRPANTFNLQSVELLQGPASILYGQGAVGGALNVITKQPVFGPTTYDGLFSYGSFNTITAGVGMNTQLSEKVAIRVDLSRTSSSGYVHNDDPNSLNFTASLLANISDTVTLRLGLDVLHDNLPSYYGTPLVPGADAVSPLKGVVQSSKGLVIDGATQFANFNVSNSERRSTTISPTATLTWQPSDHVTLTNRAYMFYAERRWQNAESYSFLPAGSGAVNAAGVPIAANQIGRDRFYVYHQQHQVGDTLDATVTNQVFGFDNKYTIGVDFSYLQFIRDSGFPNADYADSVNPLSVDQGLFGSFPGEFPGRHSPTHITDVAGFAEDVLSLTQSLKLVTGVRYEWYDLVRDNDNSNGTLNTATSFHSTFHPTYYRAGLVYDVLPALTLYGQFVTAQDPPSSNVFLANAGQITRLSGSKQGEIGAKSVFLDGRAQTTLSLYTIQRDNILVTTSNDTVANVGTQRSYGAELSAAVQVTPQWKLSANAAYTHARYGTFVDPTTGLNASGNKPPDVPTYTAGLWSVYKDAFGIPIDLGGSVRYVGSRAGDYANTLKLDGYALVDLSATYHVKPGFDLTGRVANLFNKTYAQWADVNYPTELLLGEPRSLTVSLRIHL
jgi:iron complex outermembrane receptor protein